MERHSMFMDRKTTLSKSQFFPNGSKDSMQSQSKSQQVIYQQTNSKVYTEKYKTEQPTEY